jgi:hypothetical protein
MPFGAVAQRRDDAGIAGGGHTANADSGDGAKTDGGVRQTAQMSVGRHRDCKRL